MPEKTKAKKSLINRFLNVTEKVGNALPHPATLFAMFALAVLLFSWIAWIMGWSAIHPATEKVVEPVNLLSEQGLHRILREMVTNFTDFAPLGIVLVAMLGIGIAESSGLISALIRLLVLSAPKRLLTFVLVFTGILSNVASDVGYVLLIPLAGVIFIAIGRHPVIGMAAAFAGVSGGFSANLLLGTVDPLLAGLSTEAARIIDPAYDVNPTANYYFMVVSTFFVALVGTWVTEKVIAPRFGKYEAKNGESKDSNELKRLSKEEKKGLRWAGFTGIALTIVILIGIIPASGFLRGPNYKISNETLTTLAEKDVPRSVNSKLQKLQGKTYEKNIDFEHALKNTLGRANAEKYTSEIKKAAQLETGGLLNSPLLKGVVAVLFLFAGLMGVAYGFGAGAFKTDADIMKGMSESMKTMSLYIVLVFFAAQFVAYFKWSNLGIIIAIKGANAIAAANLGLVALVILFVLLSAGINMLMGSASAKWAIMAPVFIPMFMLLGYSPELSQVVYRIGDSVTNVISPMMSFFALIIAFIQKYDSKAGIGTVIATMLPYSVAFLIVWTIILIVWIQFGLPLGPDAGLYYDAIAK